VDKQQTQKNGTAIGTEVSIERSGPSMFRSYVVERPTPASDLHAVEGVLDVSVKLSYPAKKVWPVFKNFDSWMNRFGYVWQGLPADNENNYVYLGNSLAANDLKYGSGGSTNTYIVRKVIEEKLLYFDSLPYKVLDKDSMFTGHNLMTLNEEGGQTEISIFMEHTWYSKTMELKSIEAEARQIMCVAVPAFWRDYFIPDLISLVESGKTRAA